MLLELVPEELSPISSYLHLRDLKSLSLCSKRCNVIVAPWLWEAVKIASFQWETTRWDEPIPAHIVHCRSLTLTLIETENIEETKEKMISLIKLSDPITLALRLSHGHEMLLAECLSTISEMENFTRLKLFFSYKRLFQIDESFAKKLKVLYGFCCELASIDRLTSLVELNLQRVKM